MPPNFMFKVKGVGRLMSYEEVICLSKKAQMNHIRVIDLQTQRNWTTNLATIVGKFK